MTSNQIKELVAQSSDHNGTITQETALLEIAYQLAKLNEHQEAILAGRPQVRGETSEGL